MARRTRLVDTATKPTKAPARKISKPHPYAWSLARYLAHGRDVRLVADGAAVRIVNGAEQ